MNVVRKVLEQVRKRVWRRELFHGHHLDEVFEFIVEFEVSFAAPDLGNFDGLVVVLYSGDDVLVVVKLDFEVCSLVLSDGELEGELLLGSPGERIEFRDEDDIARTKAWHVYQGVLSRVQSLQKNSLGDVQYAHVLLDPTYGDGPLASGAELGDEIVQKLVSLFLHIRHVSSQALLY